MRSFLRETTAGVALCALFAGVLVAGVSACQGDTAQWNTAACAAQDAANAAGELYKDQPDVAASMAIASAMAGRYCVPLTPVAATPAPAPSPPAATPVAPSKA